MSFVVLCLALAATPSPGGSPPESTTTTFPRIPDGLGSAVPPDAPGPQPPTPEQAARSKTAIAYAREKVGEPYRWEGRGTAKYPDWDCLGILFRAYGKAVGRGWWTFEVNPSELVANGKLGAPVPGVDGVLREEVPIANLMPGDVLYFLKPNHRIPDTPLMERDGVAWWPWHTGMYLGEGKALHAEPGGVVRVQDLADIDWDGLLATRLP